jgi:glucokinase
MKAKTTIGLDIGGTRIKGVLLQENNIIESVYRQTGEGEAFKKAALETVEELKKKSLASEFAIGISAPGIPNDEKTAIAFMPGRLPGLENFIWSDYFKHPTCVLNDAVCALYAEAKMGAAVGAKHAVLLTLGTGVGGAILIDGNPFMGAYNKAGHWGHTSVDFDGFLDVTGMPGSIEEAIGNVSVARRSAGKFQSTQQLIEAVRQNDSFAQWVWLSSIQKLSVTISSIASTVSPEVVVLGGGIAEVGDLLFKPLKRFMEVYEWRPGSPGVKIVKAQFSDLAGAMGAACFADDFFSRK